jgi:hypothetical protein
MNGRHSLIDGYKSPRFASPEFIHLSKGLHGSKAQSTALSLVDIKKC